MTTFWPLPLFLTAPLPLRPVAIRAYGERVTTELTRPLAGTGEDGRHLYPCPLCEAMCGLEIDVQDARVTGIRGNRDDVWSHGHLRPKGVSLGAVHEDGKPGTRMSVANGSPGVNTNALSPPTFIDEPSGNGALNGIPVTVART